MSDPQTSIHLVERLLKMLEGTGVAELEVRREGFRVQIQRTATSKPEVMYEEELEADQDAPPPAPVDDGGATVVKSDYVGSFLRPEDGNFPQVGVVVTKGTRLADVEVLGIPNPVLAPVGGTLLEVRVEDGSPVEYGQVLAIIRREQE